MRKVLEFALDSLYRVRRTCLEGEHGQAVGERKWHTLSSCGSLPLGVHVYYKKKFFFKETSWQKKDPTTFRTVAQATNVQDVFKYPWQLTKV